MEYLYNGKSWKVSSTVSDKNSFFHSAFGVKADEDEPYLDKFIEFRRSRWATFLNYFEDKAMPPRLTVVLKNCLSANEKYKHASVEDHDHFEGYISDITKAEHDVTMEEIPILVALDNVKVVLFKDKDSEPAVIINPENEILESYPYMENPKGTVVLHLQGNVFSRMDPLTEDSVPTFTRNDKIADVETIEESGIRSSSDLIKYKKGGNAGSEGVQFQVGLITVFLLNALQKLRDWKLSTENTAAGKFDDVVLERPDGATLLQAKHKQNKRKKITLEELLSTNSKNDDFSLPKYFLSYVEIKKTFNVKEVIICTNTGVDDKAMEFLKPQKVKPESLLHYENCDCKCYTFTDEIRPHLKENIRIYYENNFQNKGVNESTITDDNIRDFLKHLELFVNYPPGNDVGKVIEELLFYMKLLDNSYVQISPVDIHAKMLGWFQQKDGVYITEVYAKAIFSEIWTDKHWQKLEKYEIFFQCGDLNFQGSKKLFHLTVEGGWLLQEMKIFRALQRNKMEILFFNSDDGAEKQKRMMEAFSLPQYTILIIVWPKITEERVIKEVSCKLRDILDKFEYKKIVLVADCKNKIPQLIGLSDDNYDIINQSITLEDFSKDSRERLLEKDDIIFQGNYISLKELLARQASEDYAKFLSNEELEMLVRGEKVKVGAPLLQVNENITGYYINRKFKRRDEIFTENLICEMNEKVLLISDSAGTGKSTVLTNLATTIKKKYPHLWVIRIDLNNYTQILKDYLGNKKISVNILELLNSKHSTKLTNYLEQSVFSINSKVVLMLDGFDEISPEYTELVLNMLSLCQRQQNFCKIIVTTRPHLAEELKIKLQVESFILEPFTEQNQNDFLAGYWMHNLEVDNTERGKCEEYAKALIKKMSSWVLLFERGTNHFAAIPLHVRMLAEVFQENSQFEMSEDLEGCKEFLIGDGIEPKLPESMKVTVLYEMFIEKKRSVFTDKGNPSGNTAANQALFEQFKECVAYHRSLALEFILDIRQCGLFSCRRKTLENMEMNILKIGIIQKMANEFDFVHRTFAEYFVAQSLIEELQLPNEIVEFQMMFIEDILLGPQFNVIRLFFNSFLQQMIDDLSPNTFYTYQCASYKITSFDENKWKSLMDIIENGYLAIFQLILQCVDLDFFTAIPGSPIHFFETPTEENIPKYSKILNVVQQKAYIETVFRGITFLVLATASGHLEMVKFLVEQGANVNIGEFKPLRAAVTGGHLELAKFLVEVVDVKTKNSFYFTTELYRAVLRKDTAMCTYLLDTTLRRDSSNITNSIIPYTAAYLGRIDILETLLEQDLDVNGRIENDEPVIFGAVRGGQLEAIRYLVQHGSDVNSSDHESNTALHITCRAPLLLSTAILLLELRIDVNAKNFKCLTALHIAVEEDNVDLIELLVIHDADINLTDRRGMTALHIAVERDNFDLIKLLVCCKAEVNLEDAKGNTAFHIATKKFLIDIVRFLLEHGANINSKNKDGSTALHLAIEQCSIHLEKVHKRFENKLDLIKLFIESGVDTNMKNRYGSTVLHVATNTGQLDTIILLVESGVDVDITDNDGESALHSAALKDYTDIIKFLVTHNADSNIKNNSGNTVLHSLIQFNSGDDRYDTIKLVVENGGDVNIRNNDGRTTLHLATIEGNLDVVILLVESGVDVNITDNESISALHLAALKCCTHIFKFLVKHNADSSIRDKDGETVFHYLVALRFVFGEANDICDILRLVLEFGGDVNLRRNDGRTTFHLASSWGDLDIVILLMEFGADVNVRDAEGCTGLHLAAVRGHFNIVKYLLKRGLDVSITDNSGYTALHLAANRRIFGYSSTVLCRDIHKDIYLNIVEILIGKCKKVIDIKDNTGCTALHLSVVKGNLKIVKSLVEHGANLNNRNVDGCTVLHSAIRHGHVEIVKFLLDWDIDVDIRDNNGRTALHLAVEKNDFDIAILLIAFSIDVDARDEAGDTALHDAVSKGYFKITEYLVGAGVDVRIRNNRGHTALHLAVNGTVLNTTDDNSEGVAIGEDPPEGTQRSDTDSIDCDLNALDRSEESDEVTEERFNLDIVNTLLATCNESVDIKDESGSTALHLAVLEGHLEVVEVLVKYNAGVNNKDLSGQSALQLAVEKGKLDIVKLLVECGANINDRDSNLDWVVNDENRRTVLHLAAERGELDTVVFFAELGIDVNVTNDQGYTASRLALDRGHLRIVKYLVETGASVTEIENYERSVLHLAVESGDLDIIAFFAKRCTNISATDDHGNTALHSAVRKSSLNIVTFLVDFGIDVNVKNSDGRTALHVATEKGYLDIANFLVKLGADLNITDNGGSTALHLAACYSLDLVKFLVQRGANIYINDSNGDTAAIVAKKSGCKNVFLYLEKELCLRTRLFPKISKWFKNLKN